MMISLIEAAGACRALVMGLDRYLDEHSNAPIVLDAINRTEALEEVIEKATAREGAFEKAVGQLRRAGERLREEAEDTDDEDVRGLATLTLILAEAIAPMSWHTDTIEEWEARRREAVKA